MPVEQNRLFRLEVLIVSVLQVKANPPKPVPPKVEEVKGPPDLYGAALRRAGSTTAGLSGILALGFVSPSTAFSSMFTKFGLSTICGYQVFPNSGKQVKEFKYIIWFHMLCTSVVQACRVFRFSHYMLYI